MKKRNFNYKVKRENGSYDKVEFSFRFINLDENVSNEIILKLQTLKLEKFQSKKMGFVILIDNIDINFDSKIIKQIISEYNLNENDFGFWCSVTSDYTECGAYIPQNIKSLFHEIGGQFDISILVGSKNENN